MRKKKILPVIIPALLSLLAGCHILHCSADSKDVAGSYILVNRPGAAFAFDDNIQVRLNLEGDSAISGHTGCNEFGGTCHIEQNTIRVERFYMTRRMCENTPWENQLVTILETAGKWRLHKGILVLETQDGKKIFWEKYTENQSD